MKSIRLWEELSANAWPSFEHILYDGWLLRFGDGFSAHNNSVWPLYPGELPLEEKIAFCERHYAERRLTCAFRLSEISGHDAIEQALLKRGYVVENPNLVMVCSSMDVPEAEVTELMLNEWLEVAYRIHPVDDPTLQEGERKVLSYGSLPRHYAIVERTGQVCAYGLATQQGNILSLRDLWTLPVLRGQGIGTQLIHGLLQIGRTNGVEIATLSVNEPNMDARRLYERLGFEVRYRYRYMELAE